jgi:uncharacterized protein (UPF0262 family)
MSALRGTVHHRTLAARQFVRVCVSFQTLLVEIRIHDGFWDAADDERRREWTLLIAELIQHHPDDGERRTRLRIVPGEAEGTRLILEDLDGTSSAQAVLPAEALAPHFRAYLDVCKQMLMLDEGVHSARLEALDMGKRVMHDRAAHSLLVLCGSVIPDHATARRLFSLLTSLEFDVRRPSRS